LRLLVTGGAGFIGSNYIRRIVDGSLTGVDSIILLDKLTYAGTLSNLSSLPLNCLEFIEGDICDQELVDELTSKSDAVVNFAAESHVDRSILGSRVFFQTNVLGVQTLLDAARRNDVETFVQVSTDEVYGSILEGSWPETDPLLPNSPYAASKASGDLICRSFFQTYGFDVRVTRSSNNYGPHQFPEKIIPLFITNLIDNLKIPIYGTGSNIRDWLHVDDHCMGVHLVLTNGRSGEIYNIGGGTELTNFELTQKILKLMDKDDSSIEYVSDRLGHDSRYSVDVSKISRELQYQPAIDFENGLLQTVNWYLENEKWWRGLKQT
jgi:dTDP-glucose 4,6-dehydratase